MSNEFDTWRTYSVIKGYERLYAGNDNFYIAADIPSPNTSSIFNLQTKHKIYASLWDRRQERYLVDTYKTSYAPSPFKLCIEFTKPDDSTGIKCYVDELPYYFRAALFLYMSGTYTLSVEGDYAGYSAGDFPSLTFESINKINGISIGLYDVNKLLCDPVTSYAPCSVSFTWWSYNENNTREELGTGKLYTLNSDDAGQDIYVTAVGKKPSVVGSMQTSIKIPEDIFHNVNSVTIAIAESLVTSTAYDYNNVAIDESNVIFSWSVYNGENTLTYTGHELQIKQAGIYTVEAKGNVSMGWGGSATTQRTITKTIESVSLTTTQPVPGNTVWLSVTPDEAIYNIEWYRDNSVIEGQTDVGYSVTRDDVGHIISAKIIGNEDRYWRGTVTCTTNTIEDKETEYALDDINFIVVGSDYPPGCSFPKSALYEIKVNVSGYYKYLTQYYNVIWSYDGNIIKQGGYISWSDLNNSVIEESTVTATAIPTQYAIDSYIVPDTELTATITIYNTDVKCTPVTPTDPEYTAVCEAQQENVVCDTYNDGAYLNIHSTGEDASNLNYYYNVIWSYDDNIIKQGGYISWSDLNNSVIEEATVTATATPTQYAIDSYIVPDTELTATITIYNTAKKCYDIELQLWGSDIPKLCSYAQTANAQISSIKNSYVQYLSDYYEIVWKFNNEIKGTSWSISWDDLNILDDTIEEAKLIVVATPLPNAISQLIVPDIVLTGSITIYNINKVCTYITPLKISASLTSSDDNCDTLGCFPLSISLDKTLNDIADALKNNNVQPHSIKISYEFCTVSLGGALIKTGDMSYNSASPTVYNTLKSVTTLDDTYTSYNDELIVKVFTSNNETIINSLKGHLIACRVHIYSKQTNSDDFVLVQSYLSNSSYCCNKPSISCEVYLKNVYYHIQANEDIYCLQPGQNECRNVSNVITSSTSLPLGYLTNSSIDVGVNACFNPGAIESEGCVGQKLRAYLSAVRFEFGLISSDKTFSFLMYPGEFKSQQDKLTMCGLSESSLNNQNVKKTSNFTTLYTCTKTGTSDTTYTLIHDNQYLEINFDSDKISDWLYKKFKYAALNQISSMSFDAEQQLFQTRVSHSRLCNVPKSAAYTYEGDTQINESNDCYYITNAIQKEWSSSPWNLNVKNCNGVNKFVSYIDNSGSYLLFPGPYATFNLTDGDVYNISEAYFNKENPLKVYYQTNNYHVQTSGTQTRATESGISSQSNPEPYFTVPSTFICEKTSFADLVTWYVTSSCSTTTEETITNNDGSTTTTYKEYNHLKLKYDDTLLKNNILTPLPYLDTSTIKPTWYNSKDGELGNTLELDCLIRETVITEPLDGTSQQTETEETVYTDNIVDHVEISADLWGVYDGTTSKEETITATIPRENIPVFLCPASTCEAVICEWHSGHLAYGNKYNEVGTLQQDKSIIFITKTDGPKGVLRETVGCPPSIVYPMYYNDSYTWYLTRSIKGIQNPDIDFVVDVDFSWSDSYIYVSDILSASSEFLDGRPNGSLYLYLKITETLTSDDVSLLEDSISYESLTNVININCSCLPKDWNFYIEQIGSTYSEIEVKQTNDTSSCTCPYSLTYQWYNSITDEPIESQDTKTLNTDCSTVTTSNGVYCKITSTSSDGSITQTYLTDVITPNIAAYEVSTITLTPTSTRDDCIDSADVSFTLNVGWELSALNVKWVSYTDSTSDQYEIINEENILDISTLSSTEDEYGNITYTIANNNYLSTYTHEGQKGQIACLITPAATTTVDNFVYKSCGYVSSEIKTFCCTEASLCNSLFSLTVNPTTTDVCSTSYTATVTKLGEAEWVSCSLSWNIYANKEDTIPLVANKQTGVVEDVTDTTYAVTYSSTNKLTVNGVDYTEYWLECVAEISCSNDTCTEGNVTKTSDRLKWCKPTIANCASHFNLNLIPTNNSTGSCALSGFNVVLTADDTYSLSSNSQIIYEIWGCETQDGTYSLLSTTSAISVVETSSGSGIYLPPSTFIECNVQRKGWWFKIAIQGNISCFDTAGADGASTNVIESTPIQCCSSQTSSCSDYFTITLTTPASCNSNGLIKMTSDSSHCLYHGSDSDDYEVVTYDFYTVVNGVEQSAGISYDATIIATTNTAGNTVYMPEDVTFLCDKTIQGKTVKVKANIYCMEIGATLPVKSDVATTLSSNSGTCCAPPESVCTNIDNLEISLQATNSLCTLANIINRTCTRSFTASVLNIESGTDISITSYTWYAVPNNEDYSNKIDIITYAPNSNNKSTISCTTIANELLKQNYSLTNQKIGVIATITCGSQTKTIQNSELYFLCTNEENEEGDIDCSDYFDVIINAPNDTCSNTLTAYVSPKASNTTFKLNGTAIFNWYRVLTNSNYTIYTDTQSDITNASYLSSSCTCGVNAKSSTCTGAEVGCQVILSGCSNSISSDTGTQTGGRFTLNTEKTYKFCTSSESTCGNNVNLTISSNGSCVNSLVTSLSYTNNTTTILDSELTYTYSYASVLDGTWEDIFPVKTVTVTNGNVEDTTVNYSGLEGKWIRCRTVIKCNVNNVVTSFNIYSNPVRLCSKGESSPTDAYANITYQSKACQDGTIKIIVESGNLSLNEKINVTTSNDCLSKILNYTQTKYVGYAYYKEAFTITCTIVNATTDEIVSTSELNVPDPETCTCYSRNIFITKNECETDINVC